MLHDRTASGEHDVETRIGESRTRIRYHRRSEYEGLPGTRVVTSMKNDAFIRYTVELQLQPPSMGFYHTKLDSKSVQEKCHNSH